MVSAITSVLHDITPVCTLSTFICSNCSCEDVYICDDLFIRLTNNVQESENGLYFNPEDLHSSKGLHSFLNPNQSLIFSLLISFLRAVILLLFFNLTDWTGNARAWSFTSVVFPKLKIKSMNKDNNYSLYAAT